MMNAPLLLVVAAASSYCSLTAAFYSCSPSPCLQPRLQLTSISDGDGIDLNNINASINTTTIANQTFLLPTRQNLQTIQERQLFHKLQPEQVFCVSSPCRHGHPQAFGFHPTNGPKLASGLFRLSCPLLVQHIDEWENQGGVREMTDWLRNDASGVKRRGYEKANGLQKDIRMELVGDDKGKLVSRMGTFNAEKILESGVAGIPSTQTYNVKCIHAHVADHLCRQDGNVIGARALEILQNQRGASILGNDTCWRQCSLTYEQQPSDWNYVPKKNRQALRSTRQRRKELREDNEKDGV